MGFFRQEYWSGLLFPSPGDNPDPGIEPWSPTLQADSLPSEPAGKPRSEEQRKSKAIFGSILNKGWYSQVALVVKKTLLSICQCRRHKRCGFDSWVRRSPGGGRGNPLQYSGLENSMTEEPGGLQSIVLQRIGHDWRDLAHTHTHTLMLTNVGYWYSLQTRKKNLVIQTLNLRLFPLYSIATCSLVHVPSLSPVPGVSQTEGFMWILMRIASWGCWWALDEPLNFSTSCPTEGSQSHFMLY